MEKTKQPIFIPWDFTEVAKYAFQHAMKIGGIMGSSITLIHITKKEEENPAAEEKLKQKAIELSSQTGFEVNYIVKSGNIFSTIAHLANEMDAELVIMGTHGIKGMQKYLGSWALKVISESKVPFLVVQDYPKESGFRNVLYPINFRKENKETISWILYLSKLFEMKVHMFAARYNDRKLKRSVASNVIFAKNIFVKKNIAFDIHHATSKKDFVKEVIDKAREINVDLILVMATRDLSLADFLIGAQEQYILSNPSKIPVLCMNPKPLKNVGGFRAGGG